MASPVNIPPQSPRRGGASLAELTLELCRIYSETGFEAAIADDLEARCRALVGPANVRRVGNSVVAWGAQIEGRPTLGLFGHSDTVKPAEDQPLEIRDGRVYGCGASDMKGGLACMLELLAEADSLGRNLIVVFYDKEEGPAVDNGLEPLFTYDAIPYMDLGVCLEPTDNRIQAGCVGGLHATLTFRGRRAHSARPWQGENAIYKAIGMLERLKAFGRREVQVGPLTFYEVMNATMASTANSRNVIPDAFALNVNYRFAPGKPLAVAAEELRELVAGDADVTIIDEAPSGEVCLDHPLVTAWQAEQARLGQPLEVEAKQAWTDVARLTARGIPAINFGPGETAQAHQARESIPVAYLEEGYAALRRLFV
ncbi:Succinyl-diaminopimelate desuccinylase [compost metagenome]